MDNTDRTETDIHQQLEAITTRLDTGGYLGYGGATQAATELLALISQTVSSVIGEDEEINDYLNDKTRTEHEYGNYIKSEQRATAERLRLLGRET